MSLAAGDKLGPYEILASIGEGGMGEVWKARDTRLDRNVALKVSRVEFSERFEREARAVASLNHPHICQLYDVGPNYLVMELIEGEPLKGPLPLEKAAAYAGQILDALDAAHRKGITHRDLKPANILITKQGAKLLDFGLAKQAGALKVTEATLTQALTAEGQIVGTLQYMSPEQLQGKEADPRSDLFSFGCVLYEMVSGKRAFVGDSPASVIAAILEREPAPLTVAPPLERIIRRSLAKDPDQRFQTACDLKAALNWALEQTPAAASAKQGRRQWIAAAALLIGFVLGGWGVSRFFNSSPELPSYSLQINPPEGCRFTFGNMVGGIAVSPGGRTAAFVASGAGKSGLWVRPIDRTASRLIPGTEGAAYPFWSPDGKSVAFFSGSKLLRVDLAGGPPMVVCDAIAPRGGAWGEDGYITFGSLADGLYRVSTSGGTPSRLTTLDPSRGEGYHRWPQVLPGGRVLYLVQSNKPEYSGVYAALLAKPGERARLLTAETNALFATAGDGRSYLLWLRGGSMVAQEFDPATLKLSGEPQIVADPVSRDGALGNMNAAVSTGGVLLHSTSNNVSQFTWINREGKPLGVSGEPGEYSTFRLSPEGGRVVTAQDRPGSTDLWLLEMERGVARRFISTASMSTWPIWSPDGRTVVFSTLAPRQLIRTDSSGAGNERRIAQSPYSQFSNDWSRDGRWLLYHELAPGTQRDLWILPVSPDGTPAPGSSPRPYVRTPFSEQSGRFSPEPSPRRVAYQSDETGRWEVYIQAFPDPRGATRVSTAGGRYPQWGPGGRELFYVSLDNRLMMVSLKTAADAIEPSAPRELFPLPAAEAGWCPYDVSPDGNRFLVRATPGKVAEPLTVVVNWPALLKR